MFSINFYKERATGLYAQILECRGERELGGAVGTPQACHQSLSAGTWAKARVSQGSCPRENTVLLGLAFHDSPLMSVTARKPAC